ncbi:MAG TPA: acetyl-CoA carboxylase biotin carboxyl carrier protein subunit [Ignavibacteria bacterium]|nr:acetyl-CoA carboxylase biotin carboxyl carrier protein subunit [Ignavibacteria bacterium]
MKKYITKLTDTETKNEIILSGQNKVQFNSKEYEYDHKFISDNVLMLRINNENFLNSVSETDDNEYYEVNIDSMLYKVEAKDELELLIGKMSNSKSDGKVKKEIYSPMPGIIKKMNVSEGQQVKKGDVLFVLEAMKMENEIKAKSDCVIKKINAEELKSVEKNELLMLLE